jgi:hypothetical protein
MSDAYVAPSNVVSRAGAGVVGGLAGAVVIGGIFHLLGVMTRLADLGEGRSYVVAWVLVFVAYGFAGGLFGVLFGRWISRQIVSAVGIGLVFGTLLWAVVGLVLIPLLLGKSVFAINDEAMLSLGAHVAFGIVLAMVYAVAGPRRRYYGPRRSYDFVYALPGVRRRRRRRRDDDED